MTKNVVETIRPQKRIQCGVFELHLGLLRLLTQSQNIIHLLLSTVKYVVQTHQNIYFTHNLSEFFAFRFTNFAVFLQYISQVFTSNLQTYIFNTIRV